MELPARHTGRQPVEPRVELPGEESGELSGQLLAQLWGQRPPDGFSVTYATFRVHLYRIPCPMEPRALAEGGSSCLSAVLRPRIRP